MLLMVHNSQWSNSGEEIIWRTKGQIYTIDRGSLAAEYPQFEPQEQHTSSHQTMRSLIGTIRVPTKEVAVWWGLEYLGEYGATFSMEKEE